MVSVLRRYCWSLRVTVAVGAGLVERLVEAQRTIRAAYSCLVLWATGTKIPLDAFEIPDG